MVVLLLDRTGRMRRHLRYILALAAKIDCDDHSLKVANPRSTTSRRAVTGLFLTKIKQREKVNIEFARPCLLKSSRMIFQ